MNRHQFWALNLASLILAALLLGHYGFARRNSRLGEALAREQAYINNARQLETVLDQLAKRIAKSSDIDPKLKIVLLKYGMNVSLEIDKKKKPYP